MRSLPLTGLILISAAFLHAQTAADTPPSLIYRSEPEYSPEATQARVQGNVELSITVGEDGKAHDIKVSKGVGFGLDEKAIEAMDKWRFNPATHEGHDVAVPANIEMNFGIQAKNDTEDRSGQRVRLNFTLPPGVSRPELLVGKLPANPAAFGDQTLRFHLQVDEKGAPKNVTVLSADDPVWGKQVQRVVQTWRFRPAALNGSAVVVEGIFEIEHSGPPEPVPSLIVRGPAIVAAESNDEAPSPAPRHEITPTPVLGLITRTNHTATRLTNGTVLIAGGASATSELSSAQTFDWATRRIANTGNLLTARQNHTATLLKDGTVLIAGGQAEGHPLASAEIFDPSTGRFSAVASMHEARSLHTAALLPDGRVLICGGTVNADSAEIYDPHMRAFLAAGAMTAPRHSFSAVVLKDGRVLLAGGAGKSAEVFNPETGAFSAVGDMTTARANISATLLDNGQVLIAGGGSAEIFVPATNSFHTTGVMVGAETRSVAVLLSSGNVLIAGDRAQTGIYDPKTETFSLGPLLAGPPTGDTATLLEDGSVLLAGSNADLVLVR